MDELPQWHDLTQEYSTKSTRSELGRWRFSLYSRAIHPDLIVSVNQIELIADTIGMQMSIVEDGHVVEYLLENHRITQVLMPETALLPESGLLARARVIGHRQLDQQFFPDLGFSYRYTALTVKKAPVRLTSITFCHSLRGLAASGRRTCMERQRIHHPQFKSATP
jgi:hypothetical protein